jgi:hypothetical protein
MTDSLEYIGGAPHDLDYRRLGAATVAYLYTQSDGAPWVCWILSADGKMHVKESPVLPGDLAPVRPDQERREAARRLAIRLNRAENFGGAWLTAWYGAEILDCFWKDQDGDVNTSVAFTDAWARMRKWPVERFLDSCAAAWIQQEDNRRLLDAGPNARYCMALGEQAPSGPRPLWKPPPGYIGRRP